MTFTDLPDGFTISVAYPKKMYENLVVGGKLTLENNDELTSLAGLPKDVRELTINGCCGLTSLVGLPEGVRKLTIHLCYNLSSFFGLPEGLQTIAVSWCHGLTSLEALPEGLQTLEINWCRGLTKLPRLPNLLELWINPELKAYGEPVKTLEAYQAVCRAHSRKKSAYA